MAWYGVIGQLPRGKTCALAKMHGGTVYRRPRRGPKNSSGLIKIPRYAFGNPLPVFVHFTPRSIAMAVQTSYQ